MKQVKIAYEKCKKGLPNRPPDEIDFGLGFRAALKWIDSICDESDDIAQEGIYVGNIIEGEIKKELQ